MKCLGCAIMLFLFAYAFLISLAEGARMMHLRQLQIRIERLEQREAAKSAAESAAAAAAWQIERDHNPLLSATNSHEDSQQPDLALQ